LLTRCACINYHALKAILPSAEDPRELYRKDGMKGLLGACRREEKPTVTFQFNKIMLCQVEAGKIWKLDRHRGNTRRGKFSNSLGCCGANFSTEIIGSGRNLTDI
jgi:hypothetical protein